MKKKLNQFICFIILAIIINPINVKALTTVQNRVCINNSLFEIIDKNNYLKNDYAAITKIEGKLIYVNNVAIDTTKNNIIVNSLGISCVSQGDNSTDYKSCPIKTTTSIEDIKKQMKFTYLSNEGKWKVEFPNASQYRIKKVSFDSNGVQKRGADGEYIGTFLNGNIDKVNAQEKYFYAFYLNTNDECKGLFYGDIRGVSASQVPNPVYNNNMCINYRSSYGNVSLAKDLVRECFDENISFSKLKKGVTTYINEIREKITRSVNILQNMGSNSVEKKYQCDFNTELNNDINVSGDYTSVLYSSGEFWTTICTEKMVLSYDDPIATTAGSGFEYNANVKIVRDCKAVRIASPRMKEQCSYGVSCSGGRYDLNNTNHGGPTEDFDQCILDCDGGKYSQSCINKCYSQTDGKTTNDEVKFNNNLYNNLKSSPLILSENIYGVKRVYNINGSNGYSCFPAKYNDGSGNNCVAYVGGGSVSFRLEDNCGAVCDVYLANGGNGSGYWENCSDDPSGDYQAQLNRDAAQHRAAIDAINNYQEKNIGFTIKIKDSYTNKTVEYKLNTDNQTVVKRKINVIQSAVVNGSDTSKLEIIYDIGLDKSYIEKNKINSIVYGEKVFEKNVSNKPYYYEGGNKYYTNVYAKSYNLYERWPTIIGFDNANSININNPELNNNIYLKFENLGSFGQWKNIEVECLYSIKSCSSLDSYKDQACLEPCKPGEICDGGEIFIYRPIDLTNPFPNREPRWNWSENGIIPLYNVNPSLMIEEIVSKGNSIYKNSNADFDITSNTSPEVTNNELDYEVVLTKQNINAIRQYNKSMKNRYTNYDLYCYKNDLGINVCKSTFIGENEFSSNGLYMTILKRGLIGCNDQLSSTECLIDYRNISGGK